MTTLLKPGVERIMRTFYSNKAESFHLRELSRRTELQGQSIVRHLDFLEKNGFLQSKHEGNQRRYSIQHNKITYAIFTMLDVEKFEKDIMNKTRLFPEIPGTCMSTSFSHIFSGGYSAGYYSYKWAEVLDADAFDYFLEKGIFNKKISMKFRNEILSKGGSEHPATLYKNFRGRDPEIKALLKRAGLA